MAFNPFLCLLSTQSKQNLHIQLSLREGEIVAYLGVDHVLSNLLRKHFIFWIISEYRQATKMELSH